NFGDRDADIRLSIDWKKLGIDPAKAVLQAPAVEGFQEERTFKTGEVIPVGAKRGWLLIIR
ncbi:MAG: DUF6067 family protein, partial [Tannerella sp.]|nr:DUF6067 family protein [Tannerella sp.]